MKDMLLSQISEECKQHEVCTNCPIGEYGCVFAFSREGKHPSDWNIEKEIENDY